MGLWDLVRQLFQFAVAAWWNKVTDEYTKPPPKPNYAIEYPEEYTRDYFRNGLSSYRWNPEYLTPQNHLYNSTGRFDHRKDKYQT